MSTAITHKQSILEQVAKGTRISDIAQIYGVSAVAITQPLQDDPEYKAAVLSGIEAKLDKREQELECATDGISFSRSRELLSHTRWLAERLARDKYGKDTQSVAILAPVFNVILASAPPTHIVIEQVGGDASLGSAKGGDGV